MKSIDNTALKNKKHTQLQILSMVNNFEEAQQFA